MRVALVVIGIVLVGGVAGETLAEGEGAKASGASLPGPSECRAFDVVDGLGCGVKQMKFRSLLCAYEGDTEIPECDAFVMTMVITDTALMTPENMATYFSASQQFCDDDMAGANRGGSRKLGMIVTRTSQTAGRQVLGLCATPATESTEAPRAMKDSAMEADDCAVDPLGLGDSFDGNRALVVGDAWRGYPVVVKERWMRWAYRCHGTTVVRDTFQNYRLGHIDDRGNPVVGY